MLTHYELSSRLERKHPFFKMMNNTREAQIVENCRKMHVGTVLSGFGIKLETDNRWTHIAANELRMYKACDVVKRLPEGYYTEHFTDDTAIGNVILLPSRNEQYMVLACVTLSSDCDNYMLIARSPCVNSDKDSAMFEAARKADRMAEVLAEDSRHKDAIFQAEQEQELLREEVTQMRYEHRSIVKELRQLMSAQFDMLKPGTVPVGSVERQQTPACCAAIRLRLQILRQDVQKHIKRIRRLADEPWLSVEHSYR